MRKVLAVALAWMLALCALPASADAATVGVVYTRADSGFFDAVVRGVEEAQAELGFALLHDGPDDGSVDGQIDIIERFIRQGVDVIAVSANDGAGLVDVLKSAMDRGIKVISWDAAVDAEGRLLHIVPSSVERLSGTQVREMAKQIGGKGQVAILRGSPPLSGSDPWLTAMQEELGKDEHKDIELVAVVYGEDMYDISYEEMQGLIEAWPNLKGVIVPNTIGIEAAAACIRENGLAGRIRVTGLGLPSGMADFLRDGTCEAMYLWNPMDWGYYTAYAAMALANGEMEGKAGETFDAGRLGTQELLDADGVGVHVVIGDPFRFSAENIDDWEAVY